MWHELASSMESTAQLILFGFVLMGSQHPLATAGIILFFVLLAVMLVAETLEDRKVDWRSGETLRIRTKR